MNESFPTGRPDSRAAQRRSRERRRRNRKRNRQFQRFLLIHQLILVLAAGSIGYLLGTGAPRSEATPTDPGTVQSSEPAPSTGPADTTAPQILGVNRLSVFLGGTVAYRSGVLVTDDRDPNPQLTVDSSQVDLSTPGSYPVVYTAADSAGNTTTVATILTVSQAPETYVEEAVIRDTADALLGEILTEDMTPTQKVEAIYDWIEGHCIYIAEFDKTDYMQAAYLMLTENRGDCYGFYAVSRLLFERLGLPNLTVTRLPNEERPTNHWWNMVSLDGGESWYHFDATPHLTYPTRTCLITDADLEAFNELMPGYYFYDKASFPRTPAA